MNPSNSVQVSVGYFHASGKALTEQNMNVYESSLPSGHNMSASKVRAESLPYFTSATNLDAYISSNSNLIKKYDNVAITEMLGTNGQTYYINDNGNFIQGWISPVDVLNSAGMPSDCYQARLYSNGAEVTPTVGEWWFDYYNGLIQFAEGYTPNDLSLTNLTVTCYVYTGKTLSNVSYSGSAISWGYQTFDVGEITGTTITLTRNDNGTSTSAFSANKIVSNTAIICQDADDETFVYSGTSKIFSSKVKVLSHAQDSVTINAVPNNVWGKVRVYYYYQYSDGIPLDFYYPSRSISDTVLTELDVEFASEQDLANKTHNSLKGVQGGSYVLNEFIHLSNLEKSKYDNYEHLINNQQSQIADINKRVSHLESKVDNIPLPNPPSITNSPLDGSTVDLTVTPLTEVSFPVTSTGLLTISNPLAITSNPSIIAGTPYIRHNPLGYDEIVVPIVGLTDGKTYSISINNGFIADNGVENNTPITCTLSTLGVIKEPIINDGTLNGLSNLDPTTINILSFEVVGSTVGSIAIVDNNEWDSPTKSIINGDMTLRTTATQQFIDFNLQNLQENMTYSIDILAGAINNTVGTNTYLNLSGKNATFKTKPSIPILTTPVFPAYVDFTTFKKIIIPISTSTSRHFTYTVDSTKISSSPSIVNNAKINGNNLEINLNTLIANTTYNFTINPNAVLNDGVGNGATLTFNFKTGLEPPIPVIANNNLINSSIQPLNLSSISFDISGGNASDLVINTSKITCTPNIIKNASVDMVNNKLIIAIENTVIAPDTNYTIRINDGSVGYKGDNVNTFGTKYNIGSTVCSFKTVDIPKITASSTVYYDKGNGSTDIIFKLSKVGLTYVSGITATGCNLNSINVVNDTLVVNVGGLVYSSSYSLNIPIGSISNGMTTNDIAVNYSFKTKGQIPTYVLPNLGTSVDPTALTFVSIPVNFHGGVVNTVDTTKIYSPQGIIQSASFNSSIGTLTIILKTLSYSKDYEILFYDSMCVSDQTGSSANSLDFSTIAPSTTPQPPTPPSSNIGWQEDFTLPNATGYYDASTLSHTITDAMIYGTNGSDNNTKLFYCGYVGNLLTTPLEVKRTGIDIFDNNTPDGGYTFDSGSMMIYFDKASVSKKIYRFINYV